MAPMIGSETDSIDIIAPRTLLSNPITFNTLNDVLYLLKRGFPRAGITLNGHCASVRINLPSISISDCQNPGSRRQTPSYPLLPYPDHSYKWISSRIKSGISLLLRATSFQGVSCALYGLLQEKLGYSFYHPRGTIIPEHASWPLPDSFIMEAEPRFEKKGFHLHTLHPTELAEQLLDPDHPGAFDDVKEYLDWLARNQQNVIQFFLVRGIGRARWISHAERIVGYAHARGILAGVQISLSMLQQQAFQAIHLLRPFPSYRKQIDKILEWLFKVKWDFITVDHTSGEHLPDLSVILPSTSSYLARQIAGKYETKVFKSTHVIRGRREINQASSGAEDAHSKPAKSKAPASPASTGIMIHTVMCYSVSEPDAPVYGNRNQQFMLDRANAENGHRETWYWPESSYWITFDSSVPLFLLPYLDARCSDMETMAEIGVAGHLTFSSGWEWGYWLTDWSVARWSWRFTENGNAAKNGTLGCLNGLFPVGRLKNLWEEALEVQNHFLKERKLLQYMSALPPFAELFPPFNRPFQPVPDISLPRLLRSEGEKGIEAVSLIIRDLDEYANLMDRIISSLEDEISVLAGHPEITDRQMLHDELIRGLRIGVLRARHRAITLRALIAAVGAGKCKNELADALLNRAATIRHDGLKLVRQQEILYRYPVDHLTRRRKSITAYGFGYLYPVSSLFFWEREEEQVRRLRFDAFFMNLWDYRRILGLGSLFR
jgi:hypothetical protein